MKLIIEGVNTGVIGRIYTLNSEDVQLDDWEFVRKILEVINIHNKEAVDKG